MADNASANGGLGSIGLLNIRSEEFYIHECVIRANAPLILSYTSNIAVIGVNYTASSSYQALLGGTGSMGVTDITGTTPFMAPPPAFQACAVDLVSTTACAVHSEACEAASLTDPRAESIGTRTRRWTGSPVSWG